MQHGILSDLAIRQAVEDGDIEIDPFNPDHVNITSYDLTLGDEVRVYHDPQLPVPEYARNPRIQPPYVELDARKEPTTVAWKFDSEKGVLLQPGVGYLMHTRERVRTTKFNPILDGKSSIGRLFIQVHATAGYGDPGFDGQYTLEVLVHHPVKVYAGMRFCQIRFHTIAGELSKTYDQVGHYTGGFSSGAVASQAWRQFKSS
jgi:dCTP deaminase